MEGQPAIWVIATKDNTGRGIEETLREARLINPIKLMETEQELKRLLHGNAAEPQLIFIEIGLPQDLVSLAMECFREYGWQTRVLAVVDGESERQLDRLYDAGVRTYVRNGFSFGDFMERARVLGLGFLIDLDRRDEC